MVVLGIDHIELIVRDVDEFVEFYEKMGFKVLMRTSHHGGSAELQLPGENQPVFEIHTVIGEENIGVNHIAFKVASAQQTYEEMLEKDLSPDRGPHYVTETGRTNVNFRDPDGWRLQMVDSDRKDPE